MGSKIISDGLTLPKALRIEITVVGIMVTPAVFNTKNVTISSVASSLSPLFNSCILFIAFKPLGAISSASALHDIGKIAIPDAILNKPGRLTDEEFEIMKTHTVTGSAILETFKNAGEDDYMRYAYNILKQPFRGDYAISQNQSRA